MQYGGRAMTGPRRSRARPRRTVSRNRTRSYPTRSRTTPTRYQQGGRVVQTKGGGQYQCPGGGVGLTADCLEISRNNFRKLRRGGRTYNGFGTGPGTGNGYGIQKRSHKRRRRLRRPKEGR